MWRALLPWLQPLTCAQDEITINYPSMFELLEDLRGMGETNASVKRQPMLSREALLGAAAVYADLYGNPDGSARPLPELRRHHRPLTTSAQVPATFQVVYLLGWRPDPSQQQPARRGSAERSLRDLEADLAALQQK